MTTVRIGQQGHGCLTQVLWFFFIGWWASQIWILLAYLFMLTVIGIPIAVAMFNKVPMVIALRGQSDDLLIIIADGATIITTSGKPQRNILVRTLWFFLLGWWVSAFWLETAYLFCLTIIGLPIGIWMFDRVPAVVSLRR